MGLNVCTWRVCRVAAFGVVCRVHLSLPLRAPAIGTAFLIY